MKLHWKKFAGPLFVLIVFVAALWLLHRELKQYHLSDFIQALRNIPPWHLAAAFGLTVLNYVILIGYDYFGVRYIGYPMAFRRIALASFLGCAVGNNFGSLLGGSSVRYRLYSLWGLSATDIVKLVLLLSMTFWIGLFGIAGIVMVIDPAPIPQRLHLPFDSSRPIGIAFCLFTVGYLIASAMQTRLKIRNREFRPPPLKLAAAQYLIASLDFAVVALVLYVLLPSNFEVTFWHFFAVFLLAIVLAVVSTVPGGLGVFELTIIVLLDGINSHELVGSLLAFRLIYYLIPLVIGLLVLGASELAANRKHVKGVFTFSKKLAGVITPRILAATVFLTGVILLISGAMPAAEGRMGILRRALPLPAIEISHFLGSIFGMLLLVLAVGLHRRIETAWYLTIALLAGGIVASLTKGFDWEEALILGVMLLALLPAKSYFFRHGSLLRYPFTLGWFVAILIVVGLTIWITIFANRHVDYQEDLWWKFAFEGSAPRSLRALVGVGVVTLILVVARLTRSRGRLPDLPTDQDMDDAWEIAQRALTTVPHLARLGDKRFLFNNDRSAFIMYGEEGSSLIAMGDPVGPEDCSARTVVGFY